MSKEVSKPERYLGVFDSAAIIIGIILGVGIFETAPTIARSVSNASSFYAVWIVGGLFSLAGALVYAELATLFPEEGGDYVYLREAFGEWLAFLFGWSRVLIIRPGSIAAMSFPFANYTFAAFGMTPNPFSTLLLACSVVVGLTAVHFLSLKSGTWIQNVLTALKVIGMLLLVMGVFLLPMAEEGGVSQNVETNYGLAMILVLFCFGGWSEIAFVAGEIREPNKNILRALLIGLGAVSLLFVLLSFAFVWGLGFSGVGATSVIGADFMGRASPVWGRISMSVLIALCALGAVNGLIFTGARISFATFQGHHRLSWLAKWDETPKRALTLQAILSVVIILVANSFTGVVVYTTAVVWIFYALVGIAALVLKTKTLKRPYTAPSWCAVLFILSCIYVTYSAFLYDWRGSLVACGVVASGLLFLPKRAASTL